MTTRDKPRKKKNRLYLEELDHKYLAYTHCTVVEFTQEEGHVGIPRHIAKALLDPKPRDGAEIGKTTTVDPAASAGTDDDSMQVDDGTEQTPGHLAWGAFEIPDVQLEITMVQLPKGTGCTLVPTEEAIRNNFYGLKDVKLVLEQSLIRTRATLSTGDKVGTWHRGTKYLLTVTKVIPSSFQAVTCINTDIEVEIGETNETPSDTQPESNTAETPSTPPKTANNGSGFRLGTSQPIAPSPSSSSSQVKRMDSSPISPERASPVALLAEPSIAQKEGICMVQIRYSGGHGKRRFAVETAQVKDLFAFAASLVNRNERTFRLVTRFPRQELSLLNTDSSINSSSINFQNQLRAEQTLMQAGIQQGQEMFMIEDL